MSYNKSSNQISIFRKIQSEQGWFFNDDLASFNIGSGNHANTLSGNGTNLVHWSHKDSLADMQNLMQMKMTKFQDSARIPFVKPNVQLISTNEWHFMIPLGGNRWNCGMTFSVFPSCLAVGLRTREKSNTQKFPPSPSPPPLPLFTLLDKGKANILHFLVHMNEAFREPFPALETTNSFSWLQLIWSEVTA